ncbi:hypothetical protein B0I35DRAFT_31998 [Stachybotrys elegans]|uniref:Uncharacterized protein n=1 Tax=Stachybotrys elegans TaxID=80388 RepID=A0A8K0T1W6_9HYPO|nr:hypothetical protein B0I35DRAFT_31998 [Stachybotrys elegans]
MPTDMSADTTPITAGRFAAALKDLSVEMLHLKVLEIRNSIAHLQFSNDQLRPFADGSATAQGAATTGPDPDCVEAIRENEQVIDRMAERVALIRLELEDRGVSWDEFMSKEEVEEAKRGGAPAVNGASSPSDAEPAHAAWSDGTFQTGVIRDGEVHMDQQPGRPSGGTLSDEELRRQMEARFGNLEDGDGDSDGGMHL